MLSRLVRSTVFALGLAALQLLATADGVLRTEAARRQTRTAVSVQTSTFAYDWNNRLTSATVDGSSVSYGYSGDDLRTSRTEGGITESYLWDRLSALPTMVSDGTTATTHRPHLRRCC